MGESSRSLISSPEKVGLARKEKVSEQVNEWLFISCRRNFEQQQQSERKRKQNVCVGPEATHNQFDLRHEK